MESSVAWLWVIEYLASFHQIHPSILHDLIDEAPDLPEDLGQNTREMVALKCLEHLFTTNSNSNSNAAAANNVPSVSNPKSLTFDLSQSCEDVLQSILKESSVSDLKMAGPDLLKWDVQPFISQKRASMPKCALEQLKDAILEGTHPFAASLRKFSGLVHKIDENEGITVDFGTENDGDDTQIMAPGGSSIHLPLEKRDGTVGGDFHQKNLLPLKRNGNVTDNERPDGDNQEDQGGINDGDLHLNAKRFKHNGSCDNKSGEQILCPQSGNLLGEDSFEKMIGISEGESSHVIRVSAAGELGECRSSENDYEQLAALERHGRSPAADAYNDFQKNQYDDVDNANEMPQGRPGDGAGQHNLVDEVNDAELRESNGESLRNLQNVSIDGTSNNRGSGDQLKPPNVVSLSGFPRGVAVEKSEGGRKNLYRNDTSSESDGYHHEKIDVDMQKSRFLSSYCTLSHVSLSDWTELNLCVRCSKEGQLLVCNAVGCPFVVHEKCLGCSPNFDEKGKFYCPFCAYSYAISKYLEAKEKANLARRELAAFINKRPERSHIQNASNLEQDRNEDHIDKTYERGDLGEREFAQANSKEHTYIVNGQIEKPGGNKQLEEPILSCSDANVMHGDKEPDVTQGITHISLEHLSARGLDRQDQTSAGIKCHGDNPMFKDKENISNKKEAEGIIQKKVPEKQSSNPLEKPVCAGNIDKEEHSDSENVENMVSNYSIRPRRRGMEGWSYVYQATPQLRRKKVPWTPKEEEMLKDGVQKFSNIGDRTIPWKKILEYGSSVFFNRNTIDLKDKWRNICKGSPKCK